MSELLPSRPPAPTSFVPMQLGGGQTLATAGVRATPPCLSPSSKVTPSCPSPSSKSGHTLLHGKGSLAACATLAGGAVVVRRGRGKRSSRCAVVALQENTKAVNLEGLNMRIERVSTESAKLKDEVAALQQSVSAFAVSKRQASLHQTAPAAAAARVSPPPPAHSSAPSASAQSAAHLQPAGSGVTVPSDEVLGSVFDLVCNPAMGSIGLGEMYQVIDLLNLDYHLGLEHTDAARLLALLEKTAVGGAEAPEGRISRIQFVRGVSQLASALERIGAAGFSLLKMKSVLVAVFERFDADQDGTISREEFMMGLGLLGLQVSPEDAACLHSFFGAEECIRPESLSTEPPLEEKIASIFQGGVSLLIDKFNLGSFSSLMESVGQALAKRSSSPQESFKKFTDTLWEESEELCDAAEGAVEMASLAVGLQYLLPAAQSGLTDGMDLDEVAPFVILLAVLGVKINKDLSELVPRSMTEDEALLYWGVFQKHGFSQASFARLMAANGCSWRTAKAGEILSDDEENSLRIIIKGPVAVEDGQGNVEALPTGMLIGETAYLGGPRLWRREAIFAQGAVTYVHLNVSSVRECLEFDPEASSCMLGLITESMISNFRLASRLRAERAGSDAEEQAEIPVVRRRRGSRTYDDIFDMIDIDDDGTITREELRTSMDSVSAIFQRLGFQASDTEFERIFSYLDVDGDGVTTRQEFSSRLRTIEDWNQNLNESNMTLADLSFVLVRAHNQIDANGDGQISPEEFWEAVQRLNLSLDKAQSNALHAYLDKDGDGNVDVEEWQASTKDVQVMAAFRDIMSNHADKKGLTKFAYFNRQMQRVLQGPEEPAEKLRLCIGIAWDGIESLGDVASLGLDVFGYLVAMVGISKQFSGIAGEDGSINNLDLAPFVLFLGVSAVQFMRKVVEDSAKDLADREALLYTKAFENTDISLSDFRKLVRQGAPRWESFPQGSVLMQPDQPDGPLRVVMQGSCSVSEGQGGLKTEVRNGGFLCNSEYVSEAQSSMHAVVLEQTTTLTWEADKLRQFLERHADLRRKLQRAITTSTATSLLQVPSA